MEIGIPLHMRQCGPRPGLMGPGTCCLGGRAQPGLMRPDPGPCALVPGRMGPNWSQVIPYVYQSTTKSFGFLCQTDSSAEQKLPGHNDTRPKKFRRRRTFLLYHFVFRRHMLIFMSGRLAPRVCSIFVDLVFEAGSPGRT